MDFEELKKTIATALKIDAKLVEIGYPPQTELGDLTIPCFILAKELKTSPANLAQQLVQKLPQNKKLAKIIEEFSAAGPYLNLKLKPEFLLNLAEQRIDPKNWKKLLPVAKTMVEFLSPNTNKPLHLGHLRNAVLGDSISNILQACGQKVFKVELINDRGIHICKSMLAWQKWSEGITPASTGQKGDHFVGDLYVKFSQEAEKNPGLMDETRELLKKWEAGDKPTIKLWQIMNQWVLEGFDTTLKRLGVNFDRLYFESQTYKLGKDIIKQGLAKGIFKKQADSSVVFPLPESEFGLNQDNSPKLLLLQRADGTSVYMTQELGTTIMKFKDYRLNRSIIVTGSEQDYHFKCLSYLLKALNYKWAGACWHLSYGMVNLPAGKMKSREGTVVDADDLMDEMLDRAKKVLREKNPNLAETEINKRSEIIGLGGMKFFLLAFQPKTEIKYDPAASISLDGLTATYCQYAAVRAFNVLEKAENLKIKADHITLKNLPAFKLEEREVLLKLIQLPEKIRQSALELDPSILARHIYEISKSFNQFYNAVPKEESTLSGGAGSPAILLAWVMTPPGNRR